MGEQRQKFENRNLKISVKFEFRVSIFEFPLLVTSY
jgi:hypothetical protein